MIISIYEHIVKEHAQLERKIQELEQQLKHFPKGKISCAQNGKYYKWYHINGSNQTYIPKRKQHLAEALAIKKYLSLQLNDCLQEKKALEFYLRHHNKSPQAEQLIKKSPEYQKLLASYFSSSSDELNQWMNEPYENNTKYPEQKIYKTYNDLFVRSKSEAIISMSLYTHKIPFRYECMLQLGETILYPDFTIRHPKTGEFFFWEHFGLMDNYDYHKNAHSKLQLYTSNGILPTIHLITTYETKDIPLSPSAVEKTIQYYFE